MLTPELMRHLLYDLSIDLDADNEETLTLFQEALETAGYFKATEHGRTVMALLARLQGGWLLHVEYNHAKAREIRRYLKGEEEYKPYTGPMG